MKKLTEIIIAKHPDANTNPAMQENWTRQIASAEEVARRHNQPVQIGPAPTQRHRTVLVADEVGMGKTYVALAAMAHYLFQTESNDRKVLLVVPPSQVLAAKWEQEILTFKDRFVRPEVMTKKQMRPAEIATFWDLVENLHNFQDEPQGRIFEWKVDYFRLYFIDWWNKFVRQPKHGKLLRPNDSIDFELGFINFRSVYSRIAAERFFSDRLIRDGRAWCDQIIFDLKQRRDDQAFYILKELFREFAACQDSFEPNILILRMGSIRREPSLGSNPDYPLMAYIAGRVLRGLGQAKRDKSFTNLLKSGLLDKQKDLMKKKDIQPWFQKLSSGNLCGLKDVVDKVLTAGDWWGYINRLMENDRLEALFKNLRQEVLAEKFKVSGIGLAVIDEVHNWKNGSNGAVNFRDRYAPYIPNKLIMSATPFQLHEGELKTVLSYVSPDADQDTHEDASVQVINKILEPGGSAERCLQASDNFFKSWKNLGVAELRRVHEIMSFSDGDEGQIEAALECLANSGEEDMAAFAACCQRYRQCGKAFGRELGRVVIRHTKDHTSRHHHAGRDYAASGQPDYAAARRSLYEVEGYGDSKNAFLSFLGMRAQQLLQRDCGESGAVRLLRGINSSYAAYREGLGDALPSQIKPTTKLYCEFFDDQLRDALHPKVSATVDRALDNYSRGQKTLIFCERLATQAEIFDRLKKALGDADQQRSARRRDRLLRDYTTVDLYWSRSYLTATGAGNFWKRMSGEEKRNALAGVAQALKKIERPKAPSLYAKLLDLKLLEFFLDARPHSFDYTGKILAGVADSDSGRHAFLDLDRGRPKPDAGEIGLRTHIDDDPVFDHGHSEDDDDLLGLADKMLGGRSIWHLGPESTNLHKSIWQIMQSETKRMTDREADGPSERGDREHVLGELMKDLRLGLRKVLLRSDILNNSAGANRDDNDDAFNILMKMADAPDLSSWRRTVDYAGLLASASGSLRRGATEHSRRQSLWRGVFLRSGIAAEMNGATAAETRINLCAAFNSPLMPDILICTSIGSEGIDLHLNCADIIHHDLPWNPAKLEQRTGRIDRVGSLIERADPSLGLKMNIGIPFLASDYDEFNYRMLVARAQKQEVLLGAPEFAVSSIEEEKIDEKNDQSEVVEIDITQEDDSDDDDRLGVLPESLLEYLKIDLGVRI